MRLFLTALLALILSGCAAGKYNDYLRLYDLPEPKAEDFVHCYDYGCKTRVRVELSPQTYTDLHKLFTPLAQSAEDERTKISKAIAIFETDIGAQTGTKNDKFGTFRLYQDEAEKTKRFQQDCIDESTNTTTYLALLQKLDYLKFHQPVFPATRQPFFGGASWWHQTAVVENLETKQLWTVDSWFKDNGNPAYLVPLDEWKDGWSPKKLEKKD